VRAVVQRARVRPHVYIATEATMEPQLWLLLATSPALLIVRSADFVISGTSSCDLLLVISIGTGAAASTSTPHLQSCWQVCACFKLTSNSQPCTCTLWHVPSSVLGLRVAKQNMAAHLTPDSQLTRWR